MSKSTTTIKKPTNAFQYYLKNWKNLSDDDKNPFLELEKKDKERFLVEKADQDRLESIEIRKLNMYVRFDGDRVSCVGLDNGFDKYEVRGPVVKVVKFTDKELEKLKIKGYIREIWIRNSRLIYKEVVLEDGGICRFDKERAKKYKILSYGYKGYLIENYTGDVGKYTTYNNYNGDTWTEKY